MRAAVLAVLAVALVAGCGGGSSRLSKQQFETHLKRDALLASRATTVASTANGETAAVYAKRIVRAQAEMHKAATDLGSLVPPKDAEADTATLLAALRFLDTQLGKLSQAAANGNSTAAKKVSDAVGRSKELAAVDRAVKDLQRKGYDVGLFGH